MHFDLQCLPPKFPSRGVCLGGARLGNRTLKRAETRICRMSQNSGLSRKRACGDAESPDNALSMISCGSAENSRLSQKSLRKRQRHKDLARGPLDCLSAGPPTSGLTRFALRSFLPCYCGKRPQRVGAAESGASRWSRWFRELSPCLFDAYAMISGSSANGSSLAHGWRPGMWRAD